MSIAFSKYVSITSGVGGAGGIRAREFIGRIFTTSVLLPPGMYIEFTDLPSVGAFFGLASAEYSRAEFYFGWVSKLITAPSKISFARWVSAAVAPSIYGAINPELAALNAVSAGGFTLTVAGTPTAFTGLDLSAAGSLAAVATDLQTKIRTASGTMFTAAVVTYDASRAAFDLVMGTTGTATFAVTDGAETPLAALKWTAATGAAIGAGESTESITTVLTNSTAASNNFGSFLFETYFDEAQVIEAATWNAAQNINFIYCQRGLTADIETFATDTLGLAGSGMTYITANDGSDYADMAPMIILAATPYNTRRNASQNYMFQVFPTLPVGVSDTTLSNTYDNLRINYNGQTQDNGQNITFYQRGTLGGGPTAPDDMQSYADAAWLADAAGSQLMSLLLAVGEVPADTQGVSMIIAQLVQGVIGSTKTPGTALYNGVITTGKTLTVTQQQYITSVTGDPGAWRQVQNAGWWLSCFIQQVITEDSRTEYWANYVLVYSKNDAVRKVIGSHILI